MSRYSDSITDQNGAPVVSATVYVYAHDGSLATLTADGSGALANPVTSDAYGAFYFNTSDGLYDLVFHYGGKQIQRQNGVQVGVGPVLPAEILAALSQTSAAALIGTQATGTGAKARTVAQVMDESVFASGFTGYVEAGEGTSTNSYAAIMAAITAANARNRPVVIIGRPRITQTIKLTAPTHIRFEGMHYVPGELNGGTVLIKAATCSGPAIQVNPLAQGSIIEGGGIIGEPGNTGDGFYVIGARAIIRDFGVQGMGRDGGRFGAYKSDDPWYDAALNATANANCFNLENFNSGYNTGHGLRIDDQKNTGAIDANCGVVSRAVLGSNTGHGLFADKTFLGTVFDGCLFEGNTGHGIWLAANANGLAFVGGDTEANTAGQIHQEVAFANDFYDHSVAGVIWNTRNQRGSFTPTIAGSSAAGAGTYTLQKGRYAINGERLSFEAILTWTAHTGTGNMRFTLPAGLLPNSALSAIPDFIPCVVIPNGGSLTVPAGAMLTGVIVATGGYGAVYSYVPGASGLVALAMCAAGSVVISGSYELNPPIARL